MQAVILVGGEGTRLLPLTGNKPKALVPVLNKPFLEYVIDHLHRHRVDDIILAIGHLAEPIKECLGDGHRFGVRLRYVTEDTPLGTAGAIKNTAAFLKGTFLVLNGDIFTDLDVTDMIAFHHKQKAEATIALTPVDDPTSYGLIETDTGGRITRFLEKPARDEVTTNRINAGTYVLEPGVLNQIPPQTNVSIERQVFPRLLARGVLTCAYDSPAYWLDAGTPERYFQLHRDLLSGRYQDYLPASDREVRTGKQSYIHPTARIEGPAIIGDGCTIARHVKLTGPVVIGDGSTTQEGCIIENAIVWRNVHLEAGSRLQNSILADNCRLKEGSICDGSVLGDSVTVVSGGRLKAGSRIQPGTTVG